MKNCLPCPDWVFKHHGVLKVSGKISRFLLLISSLFVSSFLYAQQSVKGRVTAGDTALGGATVQVKGGSVSTQTDANGNFTISAPSNATLVISFVGFNAEEVKVGSRASIDVQLQSIGQEMGEVVVVGYGTQLKKDLSGSVVRADMKAIEESPNISLGSALHGTVAGLNVGAVTTAGSDPTITIRGRTSISGSTSPLIVLDGIIYRGNLIDINPADIASVDVLKDASATAIYGSQASNGVILVTSKIGRSSTKPTIAYNFTYSLQEVANDDMLPENGAGFIRKIGDRYLNESRTGADLLTANPNWDPASKFFGPEILAGFQNGVENNWWELLTNKNPAIQNHNVSISGRTDLSSYFFSLGYTNQNNVVINDSYKRYSYRVNLDTKVTSWMKIGVQSFMTVSDVSSISPSVGNIIGLPPQVPYLNANGTRILQPYRGILNPFLQMDQQDLDKRNNLFGNIYADIDVPFIKGLNYRLNFAQNLIDGKRYNFNSYAQNFTGEGFKSNSSQFALTLDNILSYRRAFGNHAVNGTLVYGIEKRRFENTTARSIRYQNNVLGYNRLDAGQSGFQTSSSTAWEEQSLYAMARLGYIYNDRYIFTGTIRRDGFSGFGEANKFGVFPSAAFAWRLSEENFIKDNIPSINDLKLRLSYGLSGNRTVGRYATLAKIESSVGNGYLFGDGAPAGVGQRVSSLPNENLKWESTKSLNIGADFSLFKDRISGSVEYYIANTFDLLYNIDIPVLNGFGSIASNIGKLRNNGLEIIINGTPVQTKDFSWDVSVNFSRNRNKVVSILGRDVNGDGREDDLVSSKIFINHPYGVAYDYNIIGMWQLEDFKAGTIPAGFTYGTYKVEDLNKSGTYTAAADRKILGYTDPSYRFSFLNTLRYKAWELKFFVNSIQGGKDYYYGQPGTSLANPDNIYGSNLFKFDYWTPENPNARFRQIGYYTVALGETFSPYVQRSFVRLQDLTLSYNVPQLILQKIKLSRLKVFLNGTNLLTSSDWNGWDPETGTGLESGAYPLLKTYSVGVNLEF
ncbi:MAG: TonB-dependent receptor [Chitinophagaceae bacterium]